MTKKEKLQAKYKEVIGMAPDDSMTIKYLEEALKDVPVKKATKPKSNLIQISNGRIIKNITKLQWKNMQQFKHDWKPKVNEPIEVQKLNKDGKIKK